MSIGEYLNETGAIDDLITIELTGGSLSRIEMVMFDYYEERGISN